MSHNEQRELYELLRELFPADELRRFITHLPHGGALAASLPGASVSSDQLAFSTSDLLRRHGMINQDLFDALVQARPLHQGKIGAVARSFGVAVAKTPGATTTSPFVREPQEAGPQTKTRILLLASNPTTTMLRLDQEARNIRNAIQASTHRDRFDLEIHQAVRVDDLIPLLLKHPADIVHFSGHGAGDDGLVFADSRDEAVLVDPDALRQLFAVVNEDARGGGGSREIRCVVLNACLSAPQAAAIQEVVDCVIGMGKRVADEASLLFATNLYTTLAEGRSVHVAFELARVSTSLGGLKGEGAPQLRERAPGIARRTTFGK